MRGISLNTGARKTKTKQIKNPHTRNTLPVLASLLCVGAFLKASQGTLRLSHPSVSCLLSYHPSSYSLTTYSHTIVHHCAIFDATCEYRYIKRPHVIRISLGSPLLFQNPIQYTHHITFIQNGSLSFSRLWRLLRLFYLWWLLTVFRRTSQADLTWKCLKHRPTRFTGLHFIRFTDAEFVTNWRFVATLCIDQVYWCHFFKRLLT